MASNRMQELRNKFQGSAEIAAPTPENQFGRMKKSKEEQAKAVRIAKARAARYNMTLRSLAIKTTVDVTQQQKKDRAAVIANQKRAAKYNMTSRALPVSTGVTVVSVSKKDQENLGKALNIDVSPNIAKEVLAAVAKKRNNEDRGVAPKPAAAAAVQIPVATKAPESEAKVVKAAPSETETTKVEDEATAKKKIVMEGLGEALSSGDDEAINRVILGAFLETNAPHLVGKMDKLLNTYKTRMQELFDKLAQDFPDANDAQINGQLKADKEITDAMADNDDKPLLIEETTAAEVKATEDDDDSVALFPDNMPDMTNDTGEKPSMAPSIPEIEEEDDNSLIVDADKAYEEAYKEVITKAEEQPDIQKRISADRRRSVLRNDLELAKELRTTYLEPQKVEEEVVPEKRDSVASDSSLVQVDEPPAIEAGYIVAAEMEEPEPAAKQEQQQPVSRWAVQLQSKNLALKQKLMKQGLTKKQVDALVEDLDSNTSEML